MRTAIPSTALNPLWEVERRKDKNARTKGVDAIAPLGFSTFPFGRSSCCHAPVCKWIEQKYWLDGEEQSHESEQKVKMKHGKSVYSVFLSSVKMDEGLCWSTLRVQMSLCAWWLECAAVTHSKRSLFKLWNYATLPSRWSQRDGCSFSFCFLFCLPTTVNFTFNLNFLAEEDYLLQRFWFYFIIFESVTVLSSEDKESDLSTCTLMTPLPV